MIIFWLAFGWSFKRMCSCYGISSSNFHTGSCISSHICTWHLLHTFGYFYIFYSLLNSLVKVVTETKTEQPYAFESYEVWNKRYKNTGVRRCKTRIFLSIPKFLEPPWDVFLEIWERFSYWFWRCHLGLLCFVWN